MLATVLGCAVNGLAGEPVSVEVDIASGLPAFTIVGLPDAAVSEAKERVRAAIRNAGATFPPKRITVNLAPADMRKEGTGYDLPIAVGILLASGQIPATVAEGSVFLGELALTGDLRHVHGVLPVAAAGGHNVLLAGPPGAGKTLLARALPGILPPLEMPEALEVTKVFSISGILREGVALIRQRPFRAPHHTISNAGLVGGGRRPRPGEISLAHRGVLFMDALSEFNMSALEALRQPLEDRCVTIARAQGAVTYPADFMLVGAMNPCSCGYYGDPVTACTCSEGAVQRYQRRLSGPLLDRIDLFVEVPRVDYEKLVGASSPESSQAVRERVSGGRARQTARFGAAGPRLNAGMTPRLVRQHSQELLTPEAASLLKMAMAQLRLSARAFHRVLKVARTIADLSEEEAISAERVAEAVQYRRRQAEN